MTEHQIDLEMIAARTYRSLNYNASEMYIIEREGRRYSAALLSPDGKVLNPLKAISNTREFRALRVIAAFLKPDPSESFKKTSDLKEIYDSFDVSELPENHPWKKINSKDIDYAVELLRELDYRKITEIAGLVTYTYSPKIAEKFQLVSALATRRDALLDGLRSHLTPDAKPITTSYWAKIEPPLPLSYEVNENRPQVISSDIKKFVNTLQVPKGFKVLFRRQDQLTAQVLSPLARQDVARGVLKTELEQEQAYLQRLMQFQTGDFDRTIPDERSKIRKHMAYSKGESEVVYNNIAWSDRATPVDALAMFHAGSNGDALLISATRDLAIASRYVKFPRVEYNYRYVYVLLVPESKTVPVFESINSFQGAPNKAEKETAIIYDATQYIKAIYDSETGQFIKNFFKKNPKSKLHHRSRIRQFFNKDRPHIRERRARFLY